MKDSSKIGISLALGFLGFMLFQSCSAGIPAGAKAVENFDADKYLGRWYEIARFDFRFEKNLNNVTATYSKLENGNIRVENRGYDYIKEQWKESVGEAKFVDDPNVARLKVSFFKPIWSGYNVIDLDDDYQYALVAGKNLDYLWILSRERIIPDVIKTRFIEKAKAVGYDTDKLIWVEQNPNATK